MSFPERNCPACDSYSFSEGVNSDPRAEALTLDELRPFWAGFHKQKIFFSYVRCDNCRLLYARRFFAPEQLAELYAALEPNMGMIPAETLEATQRGYFEVVRKDALLDGGYLEIGPDVGFVVQTAASAGNFDYFWLFEPNRVVHAKLAEATKGKPHTILADMDDLSAVPDGSVGLAAMIQVLDHLLDPRKMLEQIHTKLRPGGTLMIVTHNEASLLRKVIGTRWPPFCLQHPQVYSPESISGLIKQVGYSSVSVARSTNFFPIAFLAEQAGVAIGIDLSKLSLPKTALGLKLGNMITLARK